MELKKYVLIICIIILGFNNSSCQTFFKNGTKYILTYWRTKGSPDPEQWTYVDSIKFLKTDNDTEFYSMSNGNYLLKQINQKVYFSKNKSEFYLIYDFNLNPGDTLEGSHPFGYMKLGIDSVKYMNYGGQLKKTQYVSGISGIDSTHLTFVEGIGSLDAGIEHFRKWYFEEGLDLESVCHDDTLLHKVDWIDSNIACNFDSVHNLIYKSIADKKPEHSVKIFPNPLINYCSIILPQGNIEKYRFSLYSPVGNLVFNEDFFSNNYQLYRAGLPDGIYIYIIQAAGTTFKGKLVISH